jgi:dihydroflavonol-4-reductase
VTVCVTGATGFIGGHVARLERERGEVVRVTYREEARIGRLGELDVEPVKADVLDRAAMRRAVHGCDLLHHVAGFVGARPVERVWGINALSPRIAVEAAAAEGVGRMVLTSSVAGIGPVAPGEVGNEENVFGGAGLDMTYVNAKHEGEAQALAAGVRLGVEVVIVNPSYVFGVPLDRSRPGETSDRLIGNYLLGRLPGIVGGQTNAVDVRDVAAGQVLAARKGKPGERYILGGHDSGWVELFERVAALSGVHHPLIVWPTESSELARRIDALGVPLPISSEGIVLMAQNWRYSSRKAKRELGYRVRPLDETLTDTIEWYRQLIESGVVGSERPSPMSVGALGVRLADRAGLLAGLKTAQRWTRRRFIVGV